jgi:tetraacyldisaccharide 4'-kinase
MREPAFWYRHASWQSCLLAPFGAIYGALTARRMLRAGAHVGLPVICVGNYHVGGAGKTPTVLALAALLRELGEVPFVVSRGYGGDLHGPIAVDGARHSARDVGDEPLMMAQQLPVIVARDRAAGARLARAQGASVIVLDDGFQNPALAKDFSLIVIDSHRGLGNAHVFPVGPLRAPLAVQLARTDALVVVGEGEMAREVAATLTQRTKPVLRARIVPDAASLAALQGHRVLAFAGIGDPGRFFATLRSSGIEVVREQIFPDHYAFSASDITALATTAAHDALTLVTTEKDLARLRGDESLAALAHTIVPFKITFAIGERDELRALVAQALKAARSIA